VFDWLLSIWRWLIGLCKSLLQAPTQGRRPRREYVPFRVAIHEFAGTGSPPALHWKACHPSTVKRFRAEMTCGSGHSLVLKGHSVAANGNVSPSVVCMRAGCTFHEYVRLVGWKAGNVD
jgi:hypothetical protein